MIQFIYDFCLLYKIIDSIISNVISMQTDDTLYKAIEAFAKQKDEIIKLAKILTKNKELFTSINFLKFNKTRIKRLDSNEIIHFRQKTHFQEIQLVQSIDVNITSAKRKIRIKLIFSEQYIAQRAKETYLTSICQSKAFFDLFRAVQSTEIISDNIIVLNKKLQ